MLDIAGSLCQRSNSQMTFPILVQQYLETDCHSHSYLSSREILAPYTAYTGKAMARQLQMTVTLSTLLLLLVGGWPQSLWTLHECFYFRGPLPNP